MNESELPRPTPEECSMASLAHALQLVGGFFAPLIILLIRRDSKFVVFHALQALLLQIIYMITWFLMFAVIMGVFVVPTIMREAQRERSPENNVSVEQKTDEKATDDKTSKADPVEPAKPEPPGKRTGKKSEPPPLWFIVGILLIWPVQMFVWLAMMVAAIVYCIKANRGEWAAYPVVGRWAQRLLK